GKHRYLMGAHLQNTCWHILGAWLLYCLGRTLRYRRGDGSTLRLSPAMAFFLAAFWALHPQRVEVVAWISERKELLSFGLGLGALLLFLRGYRRGRMSWLAAVLLLLSLWGKPLWITFPALAFLLAWVEQQGPLPWRQFRLLLPGVLACLLYLAWQRALLLKVAADSSTLGGGGELSNGWLHFSTTLHNYGMYFTKTFVPYGINPLYPYFDPGNDIPHATLLLLLLTALLLVAGWRLRRCRTALWHVLLPALAAFYVALVPVVGIFFRVGNTDFADRYSYLPAIFLLLAAAFVLQALQEAFCWRVWQRWLLLSGAGLILALFFRQSYFYTRIWSSGARVTAASLSHPRPNPWAVQKYISLLIQREQLSEAESVCAEKLLDYPHYPREMNVSLEVFRKVVAGTVHFKRGQNSLGMQYCREVFWHLPWQYLRMSWNTLPHEFILLAAQYQITLGNDEMAAELFMRGAQLSLESQPDVSACYYGQAALLRKNYPLALFHFRHSLELNADNPGVRRLLSITEQKLRSAGLRPQ
ncbi:MAG: hypothetical protein GX564_03785, partial [Oligosphaeraceae bacterium]|nr:hypothetical protein [Oligosphaeraceae bacterium]